MTSAVCVLVADNAPMRFAVRLALDGLGLACAEAGDRAGAVRRASADRPDVCLLGSSLRGGAVETIRDICRVSPETSVVVLADGTATDGLLAALRAGAVGYLPVDFEPAQLRRTVVAVRQDQAAIPRSMVRKLVDEIHALERAAEGDFSLREIQVLEQLRRGRSTSLIAANLGISPVTVRRHISLLVQKSGVSGRAELLAAFQ